MHDPDFTLPVHYIRLMADLLAGKGVDTQAWLTQGGLSQADLADAGKNVPYPVLHKLVTGALRMSGDPAVGLLMGERLRVNTHGILGYAAMSSGTLRQAVELFERFLPLRTTLVSVHHVENAGEMDLRFAPARQLDEIEHAVLETIVLTVKNLTDHITMGQGEVLRVYFAFPEPDYASLARGMFGCEVIYGHPWTGYSMSLDVVDQPLSASDPASFEEGARICQRELDKRSELASMGARVRRLMFESQNGFPSLEVTARLFNLTPRTLHRRLIDEGTSYHDIVEEVRHGLAVQHLRGTRLSIQEIAYSLGYNDQANFRRAFKRWEGVSPSAFREAAG